MALKGLSKRNLKIIAATSMTVFTLLVSFSAAYAWFGALKSSKNTSTPFGVSYDDSTIRAASVYCIKYDGVYGATATKLTESNYSLAMSEYDYIFQDRNINTPLFLRIVLEDFDKTKDLTVVIPSTGDYKTGSNLYINNYLSNVVCAKFSYGLQSGNNVIRDSYTLEGNTINGGDAQIIYEGMRDRAIGISGTPFVTNAATGAKNSTISVTIPRNTITDTYISDNKVVVYLEFDYYVENGVNLVDNYINSYSQPGVVEEPDRIFESDIGLISLRDSD